MDWPNPTIAQQFDEIADYLEMEGENVFRVRAYRNAAAAIRDYPSSIQAAAEAGEDLSRIPGIGDTIEDKIRQLVSKGSIDALETLRSKYPPTLLQLMKVPGLGAKKVATLYRELGVVDIATAKAAAEAGKIQKLKGFGAKTEQSILHGLEIAQAAAQRIRIDKAAKLVSQLRAYLQQCPEIERFEFAGSYRRGRETVGDLDILAVAKGGKVDAVMDHFAASPQIAEVLQRGDTKMSVRLAGSFQTDLRLVEAKAWGAALQYFTGSQQHNIRTRHIARDRGLKLNEYGLFPLEGGGPSLDCTTEELVYSHLGLPWVPPEFRENRFEFSEDYAARASACVELADVLADLHMHTTATDGTESIETMVAAAKARGYRFIAITDHSQRVTMARGLTPQRAEEQWAQIDAINAAAKDGFRIFKGIECDILESGELDLPDETLRKADWVLASVHYGQKQSREQITDRILNAIRNPYVSAIAHPTGRLIGRREAYEVDLDAVFAAAVEHDTIVEINSNPHRLDLSDVHAMQAAAAGALFTMNTDAHSIEDLDLMPYGVCQARRAGLPADRIVNTWPLDRFLERLANRPH